MQHGLRNEGRLNLFLFQSIQIEPIEEGMSQDLLGATIRAQSLSLILAQQFLDKVHSLRRGSETMPFLYRPLDRRFQY